MFHFSTVEEALDSLRKGRIILVTDDEDRGICTETKNKNTEKKGKRKRRHLIRKAFAESGKKPYLY